MMFDHGCKRPVALGDIDVGNRYFKLSRSLDERLVQSIGRCGIIDPPVLAAPQIEGDRYTIVAGHNRIGAASLLGHTVIDALVVSAVSPIDFLDYGVMKNYRGEMGPIGRLRLLSIVRDDRGCHVARVEAIAGAELHIPEELARPDMLRRVAGLPSAIIACCDDRGLEFKVIKNLLSLDHRSLGLLERWIGQVHIRTNLLKKIIVLLLELRRRGETLDGLDELDFAPVEAARRDEHIAALLFALRYPEYSAMKREADLIADRISRSGVDVRIPEYFEGDRITLSVALRKGQGIDAVRRSLDGLDGADLERLLALL